MGCRTCGIPDTDFKSFDHHLPENAEFIANSRQDIPDLIAHARALQQQLAEAQAEIERLREEIECLEAYELGEGN